MNTIDEALHQAALEGLPIAIEASGWTELQKRTWYESLFVRNDSMTSETVDVLIDDAIEYRIHNHRRR